MKGKYLSESQSQVQKQEMLEKLLSTEKKHAINLEAINSNLRNEVDALTTEIKVISAQLKKYEKTLERTTKKIVLQR